MVAPKKKKSFRSAKFHRDDWPFYWIARVNARYSREMERALKAVDCDISRWRILAILHEQGRSSVSEIATHAIAKLSTTTKIIYRMKDQQLVATAASDADRRVTLVEMTERGEQLLGRIRDATHTLFDRSFEHLSASQINKLNEALKVVLLNLNGGLDPGSDADS